MGRSTGLSVRANSPHPNPPPRADARGRVGRGPKLDPYDPSAYKRRTMRRCCMRAVSLSIVTVLLLAALPAGARTECKNDVTAPCVELAGHVGRYDTLLWAVCAAESETVCKCWNAQQRDSGVDWCQWAACAC